VSDPEKKDEASEQPDRKPAEPKPPEGEAAAATAEELSLEALAMADGCFERAAQATVRNNFDYAIHLFLDGLRYNLRDVEKGHKGLRDCAMRKRNTGKGFSLMSLIGQFRGGWSQMLGRPREAILGLLGALAQDPQNVMLLTQIMQMARRLQYADVAIYYGEVAAEETLRTKKPQKQIFTTLADMYEAQKDYRKAIDALNNAIKCDPSDRELDRRARNMAAEASIDEGKLESISDFHEMIKDQATAAKAAQTQVIRTREQLEAQFLELKAAFEADPKNPVKLLALAECKARLGQVEEAVAMLQEAYDRSKEYRFKMKIDDIRMAEFRRHLRELDEQLETDPERADIKAKRAEVSAHQDAFELGIYAERQRQYPTDMSIRFELGVRQYRTGDLDAAIISLQAATRDPKRRIPALNNLGKCFVSKQLYQEAQSQFETAIQQYELTGDPLAKELRYNLAMSFEAQNKMPQAIEWYSAIVQQDYQYRDAAKRLEGLRRKAQAGNGAAKS